MTNTRANATHETMASGLETVRGVQENGRDLSLRLMDMAEANMQAAFDFAREVAAARGPSDLVQAWTNNATKQFDRLTKQAGELTAVYQSFANGMSKHNGV
jgi:hypothetical protein